MGRFYAVPASAARHSASSPDAAAELIPDSVYADTVRFLHLVGYESESTGLATGQPEIDYAVVA